MADDKFDSEGDAAVEALLRGPKPSTNAFEVTVEKLGSVIKMGLILPGERLPSERDISERMGVSRTTIREAIRVLTVQGALEVRRGRMGGTFVSTQLKRPNAGELRERVSRQGSTLLDVLDLRFVVEQGVAQIAAERATDEQVRELEKLILEQAIVFPDDPVLKWNFGNLICEEDAAGNRKFSKGKASEKIDICIALCLALDGCLRNRVEVVDAAIGWL